MIKALVPLLIFVASFSFASEELDRLVKCHKQFTGEIISPDSPLLSAVRKGSKTGLQACEEILAAANLYNGMAKDSKAQEAKKILHTFNTLHNSFFRNIPQKSVNSRMVYDPNDRSYYLLKALFSSNSEGQSAYHIKNIFTDNQTYKAVRQTSHNSKYRLRKLILGGPAMFEYIRPYSFHECEGFVECDSYPFAYETISPLIFDYSNVSYSSGVLKGGSHPFIRDDEKLFDIGRYRIPAQSGHEALMDVNDWTWELEESVPVGELVGVTPIRPKRLPHLHQRLFNDADGYWRNYLGPAFKQPYPNPVENIFDNLGAGMLFTPNYQEALGMDSSNVFVQNGVDQVPREWVQDVMSDFLCREVPVIRQADAVSFITREKNEKAPFRSSSSCMRCHATLDALSYISRNYQFSRTVTNKGEGKVWINGHHTPVLESEEPYTIEPDDFFPVSVAKGHFRYRDYEGVFHNVPLTSSLNDPKAAYRQFGAYLSQMDDPYICLTGKYFKYFTGISPVFYDPGDPEAPKLNERSARIQAFVKKLGKDLKKDGDLKGAILKIVRSDLFLDPSAQDIE